MLLVAAVASTMAFAACEDSVDIVKCGPIPEGGCPRRGDACADRTCEALYTCSASGAWTPVQTCPLREAGTDASLPPDAGDASPPSDASWLDVPGSSGGPGCRELAPPDCPLARAASCPNQGCCGCEDLFVCRNGGWEFWSVCPAP